MRTKAIITVVTTLLLTGLMLSGLSYTSVIGAKEPAERFKGYNTESSKWTTGNLGKAYVEGDFVSYMLRISSASKIWGATEFSISFNFHQDSSDAVYVDGFDTSGTPADAGIGFQYSTGDFLDDLHPMPDNPGWGTYIPTPEAGGSWSSGPKIINYMDRWPTSYSEPDNPDMDTVADERYFTVSGLPWTGDHVILFFRAHLALHIVWSIGSEAALPTVLDGDEFDDEPSDWTNAFNGASFATGSSRHFFLQYEGIGGKTIPIPIAQYPSTIIKGHKYVDGDPFDGWEITLHGDLFLYGLWTIPYDPDPVLTGPPTWPVGSGYFEFTGLITGNYTVYEEDRTGLGILHDDIIIGGDATDEDWDVAAGWAFFHLDKGETATVDFLNVRPSTITGYKYEDMAGDGTAGTNIPINNWAITLLKDSVPYLGPVYTGAGDWPDGYYNFTGLLAGSYRVVEEDRSDWTHTYPTVNYIDITLGPGETKTADFYNFHNAKVIVWKYEDADGNLTTTGDWTPIDWTVTLVNGTYPGGHVFALGGDGTIEFGSQKPGTVTVTEADDPAWTHLNASTSWTHAMESGKTYVVKFVNFHNVKISGYKWNDEDIDGSYDPGDGEVRLGGWTIKLYKWNTTSMAWDFQTSTTTSSVPATLGYYEFTNLGPGRYKVAEVNQTGWVQNFPSHGGFYDITVTSGNDVSGNDFGNFYPWIQLSVTTTYNSLRKAVTYRIIVTNPLPSGGGALAALTKVTVTSSPKIGPSDPLIYVASLAASSSSAPCEFTYNLPAGHGTFTVTFTATGLDADLHPVTVEITVSVVY